MALIGIGSAQIDLILDKSTFQKGEVVRGHFIIEGGTIDQHINRIECDLVKTDFNGEEQIIGNTTMLTSRSIQPEENNKIPFTYQLPSSAYAGEFHFKTKMIFREGVKSVDSDPIKII